MIFAMQPVLFELKFIYYQKVIKNFLKFNDIVLFFFFCIILLKKYSGAGRDYYLNNLFREKNETK
jgi:hypothetical protein